MRVLITDDNSILIIASLQAFNEIQLRAQTEHTEHIVFTYLPIPFI